MMFVYIVRCIDNFLYTGITRSLRKRLWEHNNHQGALFTRNRSPVRLVYHETFKTREEAAQREKEIKGWRRSKKEKLISVYTESHRDEVRE